MDVTQTLFADQETETSLLASVLLVLMVMAVYVLVRLKCDEGHSFALEFSLFFFLPDLN